MKMGTVSGTRDVVSQSLKVSMGGCRAKAASLLLRAQPISCVRGPGWKDLELEHPLTPSRAQPRKIQPSPKGTPDHLRASKEAE